MYVIFSTWKGLFILTCSHSRVILRIVERWKWKDDWCMAQPLCRWVHWSHTRALTGSSYVSNIDLHFVLALLASSPVVQAPSLKNAVFKHLGFRAFLGVDVLVRTSIFYSGTSHLDPFVNMVHCWKNFLQLVAQKAFSLEAHLPCVAYRPSRLPRLDLRQVKMTANFGAIIY